MKKFIQLHIILIILGLILIYSVYEEKSYLRFIAILGLLIASNSLINIIKKSEEILYNFFPTKTIREEKPLFKDKIWQIISMVLFFISLIFLLFEMKNLENTFEENLIWKKSGLIGMILAAFFLIILNKLQPKIFDDSGRRYSVIFGFIFGMSVLLISLTSFMNREFSENKIIVERHLIVKKSIGGNRNTSHWIFIKNNNEEIRFKVSKAKWHELEVGKEIVLKTQIGYFNYKFVKNI